MGWINRANAQTLEENARNEFIEAMASFAKTQHVDKAAYFKESTGDLYDYLQSHIVYPSEAKKNDLSAQVFVTFLIDWKTGLPKDVKIEQSSNKIFDAEALRLIKTMPAWTPAVKDGKQVSMLFTMPIYFHQH